jgi:hypothetical protein
MVPTAEAAVATPAPPELPDDWPDPVGGLPYRPPPVPP